MELDFGKILTDIDGNPIMETPDVKLTLKKVCVNALLSTVPNDEPSGDEKLQRYLLATHIYNDEKPDVSAEEVSKIKKMVGRVYPTIIVGQVFQMLEGKI